MAVTQDPSPPEIEPMPAPVPPVIAPGSDPVPDLHDDPPPETVNLSQEDEREQSQTFADASRYGSNDIGLSDTSKVGTGDEEDDVQDLVDHMNNMVTSGRIDMDAFRGERNDDDEADDDDSAGDDEGGDVENDGAEDYDAEDGDPIDDE